MWQQAGQHSGCSIASATGVEMSLDAARRVRAPRGRGDVTYPTELVTDGDNHSGLRGHSVDLYQELVVAVG